MLDRYLDSVLPASDPLLLRLEHQARAEGVPIVGRRAALLIHLLVRVAQPDVFLQETREGRSVHRWNALVLEDQSVSGMILPIDDGLSVAVRI